MDAAEDLEPARRQRCPLEDVWAPSSRRPCEAQAASRRHRRIPHVVQEAREALLTAAATTQEA